MSERRSIVRVGLGSRAYDIIIGAGLIDEAGPTISGLRPGARAAIISDEAVFALHGERLLASLAAANITCSTVTVPPGEASKSWRELERVTEALISARIERRDVVIAFGGGVVGDLAGCAAALTRRGVDVVQMPTSLLAQVDSSVGGKTGINSPSGKNLIGAFHQPCLVLADGDVLASLSERHKRAGYAEIVKYGLLGDAPFFSWLETHGPEVLAGTPARTQAIAKSCAMKAAIVQRDETEQGERALLNLGHTFGHALEALTGYGERLLHGEAVALGMALACRFSARQGLIGEDKVRRVEAHLLKAGLPVSLDQVPGGIDSRDAMMQAIAQDKKVSRGQLTFILVRDIGEAFVARDVPGEDVARFIDVELAAANMPVRGQGLHV